MQLMTFNSLLMFDIVFVFFLFLVAVTCLVYYLPTGKQPVPSPESQCRHNRHYYYHNPNHRYHYHTHPHSQGDQESGRYQGSIKQDQNLQGHNLIEGENEELCEHHQILEKPPPPPPGHKLPPCCHHRLHHSCSCELSNCEHYFCGVDLDPSGAQLTSVEATSPPRLSAADATCTGIQLYRAPSPDCCLEDSDDNESILCGEPHRFNALSADFTEHFVVVNETERALPTPHCCYVKAKFANDKDCVGPIADV